MNSSARTADPIFGAQTATCPSCTDTFSCGVNAASCWCQALPALQMADPARRPRDRFGREHATCLCAGCLDAHLRAIA